MSIQTLSTPTLAAEAQPAATQPVNGAARNGHPQSIIEYYIYDPDSGDLSG